MTAYNDHACPNRLFDIAFTIGSNWINHESSKHDRNKKTNNRHTWSLLLLKIAVFLELYMLPFITDMLERRLCSETGMLFLKRQDYKKVEISGENILDMCTQHGQALAGVTL